MFSQHSDHSAILSSTKKKGLLWGIKTKIQSYFNDAKTSINESANQFKAEIKNETINCLEPVEFYKKVLDEYDIENNVVDQARYNLLESQYQAALLNYEEYCDLLNEVLQTPTSEINIYAKTRLKAKWLKRKVKARQFLSKIQTMKADLILSLNESTTEITRQVCLAYNSVLAKILEINEQIKNQIVNTFQSLESFLSDGPAHSLESLRAKLRNISERVDDAVEFPADVPEIIDNITISEMHPMLESVINNHAIIDEFFTDVNEVHRIHRDDVCIYRSVQNNFVDPVIAEYDVNPDDSGESSSSEMSSVESEESVEENLVRAIQIYQPPVERILRDDLSDDSDSDDEEVPECHTNENEYFPGVRVRPNVSNAFPTEKWQTYINNIRMGGLVDYLNFLYSLPENFEPIVTQYSTQNNMTLPNYQMDVRGDHHQAGKPKRAAYEIHDLRSKTLLMRRKHLFKVVLNTPKLLWKILFYNNIDISLIAESHVDTDVCMMCPEIANQVISAKTMSLTSDKKTSKLNLSIAARNCTSVNFPYNLYYNTDAIIENSVTLGLFKREQYLWAHINNPQYFH